MNKTVLYRAAVYFLGMLLAQCATAQQPVAIVLRLSGNWTVDDQPVKLGMDLFEGQRLRPSAHSIEGRVTIYYRSLDAESCPSEKDPTCPEIKVQQPIRTPTPLLEQIFTVLKDALKRDSRFVPAFTRSASIPDGYAEARSDSLFINCPGLSSKSKTTVYWLELLRLRANNVAERISSNLRWRPGFPVPAQNVEPGLYRANVLDKSFQPTGDFFLLLVLDPEKVSRMVQAFDELTGRSGAWAQDNENAAMSARRLFLWQQATILGVY